MINAWSLSNLKDFFFVLLGIVFRLKLFFIEGDILLLYIINNDLRDMAIYFLIGLLPRTIEKLLKSTIRFLVGCLVSELLNDKDNSYPPSCFIIKSILMMSQAGRNA